MPVERAEHGVDVGAQAELALPVVVIALVGETQLVLQIAETVVHRRGGEYEHFHGNAAANHAVHEPFVAVHAAGRFG